MNFFKKSNNEIKQADKFENVISYAIWHLSKREHSSYELKEKLYRKTDNEDWIDATIEYLKEKKYLDDRRFTENYLREFNEIKKYGPSKIKQEFKLKGIDLDLVKELMDESEFDYFESAKNCLNRKQREEIKDKKDRDRLTRFLLSKGFSFDMIRYAFEEHLKDEDEY